MSWIAMGIRGAVNLCQHAQVIEAMQLQIKSSPGLEAFKLAD